MKRGNASVVDVSRKLRAPAVFFKGGGVLLIVTYFTRAKPRPS
jgi:hypothetical protein